MSTGVYIEREYSMKEDPKLGAPAYPHAIPTFPWPPPAASSSAIIPMHIYLERIDQLHPLVKETLKSNPYYAYIDVLGYVGDLRRNGPLLLHVDAILRTALKTAGHYEHSYYLVPGGFALVTRLEQIKEDGTPLGLPGRWNTRGISRSEFSLTNYFRWLFVAPPGYYRLIVFVVNPHPFSQSPDLISREEAESWLQFGANAIPVELAGQLYRREFVCTALIYEFEKHDTDKDPVLRLPGRLDGRTHIINSGIGRVLR